MNIASSVSPQQIRKVVVGFDDRPASAAEIEKMKQLVAQAMEEGAVNLSTAFTGGGYKYADEMIAMAKVVAKYGGYYGTHVGGEGEQINEELDKAIRIAEETGMPVHIYHIKVRGKNNFGKVKDVIKKIEAARARVWTLLRTSIRTRQCNIHGRACFRLGYKRCRAKKPSASSKIEHFAIRSKRTTSLQNT